MSYAWFFLEESNEVLEKNVTGFTDSVKERLINYVWHGNLRELRNVVKRAVLLAQGDKVTIECLPSEIINPDYQGSDHMADVRKENGANLKAVSESAEKNAIIEVLEKTGFNKTRAAQILKIDRKTLYNKLRAYNIQL
jgi:two-component system response regulator HydG